MIIAIALAAAATAAASPSSGANPTINQHGVIQVYGQVVPSAHLSNKDNPVVCKRFVQLGSRFAARTCRLKSEWEDIAADAQRNLMIKQYRGNAAYERGGG